jgi:hypothetical protein
MYGTAGPKSPFDEVNGMGQKMSRKGCGIVCLIPESQ